MNTSLRQSITLLSAVVSVLLISQIAMAEDGSENRDWVRGSFNASTDLVSADGQVDLNLDQTLRLHVDIPGHEKIHVRTIMWMHEDLDGDERSSSALRGIDDAFGTDVQPRLLQLYVGFDDLWGDSTLRIGRQRIMEGAAFNRIDGAYFNRRKGKWYWYAFGGVRASIYRDASDDRIYGGGAAVQATRHTRIALDVFYAEEDRRNSVRRDLLTELFGIGFPRRVKKKIGDNVWALSLWQNITENIRLFGRFTLHEGNSDELLVDLTGHVPAWKFTYDVIYRRVFNNRGDRVNDVSSFFRILGEEQEFETILVSLHKGIKDRFTISLEAELRESGETDEIFANRDFFRYGASLDIEDLARGVDASFAGERIEVDGGENSWTVSVQFEKEWETIRFTTGVDYGQYEDLFILFNPLPSIVSNIATALSPALFPGFNPFIGFFDTLRTRERIEIIGVHTGVVWSLDDDQKIDVRLRYEDDEGPDSPYWRLQAGYTLQF